MEKPALENPGASEPSFDSTLCFVSRAVRADGTIRLRSTSYEVGLWLKSRTVLVRYAPRNPRIPITVFYGSRRVATFPRSVVEADAARRALRGATDERVFCHQRFLR